MCDLTEMKHNSIHALHFTQLTSQNASLTTANTNFKSMEITKFMIKLTTHIYIYRNCDIGSVEQFIVILKQL